MGPVLPYLLLSGVLATIMGFLTWLAAVARRRGTAGSALRAAIAAHDEAFRVTAHDSHWEIVAQSERKAPVMSPDVPWRPDGGRLPPLNENGRPPLRRRPRRPGLWPTLRRRSRRPGRAR